MATATDTHQFVVDWIRDRAGSAELTCDVDMDLFEAGLLDSMAFVELVIALRTATGLEVDLGAHDPESFSTIRGLLRCCGLDVEG